MMQTKWTLTVLLLFSLQAMAEGQVDQQEGGFHWKKTDHLKINKISSLDLQREFNSRSNFRGLLGLGWCSELEWSLIQIPAYSFLKKCDSFVPLAKEQVQTSGPLIKVELGAGGYLVFDDRGELRGLTDSAHKFWNLRASPGQIRGPKGQILQLIRAKDTGALNEIALGSQTLLHFDYKLGQLSEVRFKHHLSELYSYDRFSNLTLVKIGNSTTQIQYDDERDLVAQVTDSQGCKLSYLYESSAKDGFLIDQVTELRRCGSRSATTKSQFQYQIVSPNQVQLKRSSFQNTGGL